MTDDSSRHDLRNQLAIIRGFSEILLADAADDDPRRGDFEEIHKAAVAALNLVARLYPADADTLPPEDRPLSSGDEDED